MKKFCLLAALLLLLAPVAGLAEVVDWEEDYFYDTETGFYWMDPGAFDVSVPDGSALDLTVVMAFLDANSEWEWASKAEFDTLNDHLATQFPNEPGGYLPETLGNPTYTSDPMLSWNGALDPSNPDDDAGRIRAWYDDSGNPSSILYITFPTSGVSLWGDHIGAWIRTENAPTGAPVPEPATVLLLGTGLVGLVGFRKKFKK